MEVINGFKIVETLLIDGIRNFILDTGEIKTQSEIEQDGLKLKKQQIYAIEKAKSEKEFNEFLSYNFGGFSLCYYKRLLKLKLDDGVLFRAVYLGSFVDYDGNLRFDSGKRPKMKESDLAEVLGLKKTELIETKKVLLEKGFLSVNEDKTLSIDKALIKKGRLRDDKRGSTIVNRNFDETIKILYKKAKPTEHKSLAILIKILPYINFQHNVLCKNPKVSILEEIEPMTMKELCLEIGYSPNQSSRLQKKLYSIRVNEEKVIGTWEDDDKKLIVVNPSVYYKGTDFGRGCEDVQALYNLFKFGDKRIK